MFTKITTLLFASFLCSCLDVGVREGFVFDSAVEGDGFINTKQDCIEGDYAIQSVDLISTLALRELHREGIINYNDFSLKWNKSRPSVCIIEEPEECSSGGVKLGPCLENGTCARKRGCSTYEGLWVSLLWPPTCRDSWVDEPHCYDGPGSASGLDGILVHETINTILIRIGKADRQYKDETIWGPSGIVNRVLAKFSAAQVAIP